MTCIVAIKDEKEGVWIGSDYLASNRFSSIQLEKADGKSVKIIKDKIHKDLFYGVSGEVRLINLLEHKAVLYTKEEAFDDILVDEEFIVNKVVDRLIDMTKSNQKDKKMIEESTFITFATESRIFRMQEEFGVMEFKEFTTDGSGCHHAEASFVSTRNLGLSAKKRALLALDAACESVVSVGYPIYIINTVTKEEVKINTREELDKYE